jgi:hypothetical protein
MGAEMADGTREDLPTFCARLGRTYVDAPSYQRLWQATVAGSLPVERVGNRWMMLEGAEAAAVARFGLKFRQAPEQIAA